MGRGPRNTMAVTVVAVPVLAVPVRGMAGSSSSMMCANTAPGRVVTSPWDLSATSMFASPLSTQGCKSGCNHCRCSTVDLEPGILVWGMGVSTLIAAVVRGNSQCISMDR